MKKKELQEFRKLLLNRVRGLLRDIGEYKAGIKEIEEVRSADWVDKVADEAPLEVLDSLGELQRQEVAQIEKALERIEDETYGNCITCGKEITYKRLRAIPYALHCIECQRNEES